jgi:hypothetical protein
MHQQPLSDCNSVPEAPPTSHILAANLSGDAKTLGNTMSGVENGAVIVQYNIKQSTSLKDSEYLCATPSLHPCT